MSASLNPEHADAHYHFQYEQCNSTGECATPLSTPAEESSEYGTIGTTQEITGLQPQTTYRYWLVANNEHEENHKTQGGQATGTEGSFTTGSLPVPQAATGFASAVTATSATIAGIVNPDGQPATYSFELGIYAGPGTQYGVVFSGPAGAEATPVGESLAITGLQPGTTYAYRIEIASGYGTQTGAAVLFTTAGLPDVLVSPPSPPLLAVPPIVFPAEAKASTTAKKAAPKCKKGKQRSDGKCVAVKAKRKAKKNAARRTSKKH